LFLWHWFSLPACFDVHENADCFQAYYILDELLIAGELQETSKKAVLRVCAAQDALMDESKEKDRDKGRPDR